MLPPLFAGVTGWEIAAGCLVPPLAALSVVVLLAVTIHGLIEGWERVTKRNPGGGP